MDSNDPPEKYIISRELDLCEECGELKAVIIRMKRRYAASEWFREQILSSSVDDIQGFDLSNILCSLRARLTMMNI